MLSRGQADAARPGPDPLDPVALAAARRRRIRRRSAGLVVLDGKPLTETEPGPTLTFNTADHDLYDQYCVLGAPVEPMKTGNALSEHDALLLMLVTPARNCAEAVSTWAFGSRARYLSVVKTWLSAHGLSGTNIVEPTGIDSRNVSTAADLIALGKLALANPTVTSIVGSRSISMPGVILGGDGRESVHRAAQLMVHSIRRPSTPCNSWWTGQRWAVTPHRGKTEHGS